MSGNDKAKNANALEACFIGMTWLLVLYDERSAEIIAWD